jgi:hypothetical protein
MENLGFTRGCKKQIIYKEIFKGAQGDTGRGLHCSRYVAPSDSFMLFG